MLDFSVEVHANDFLSFQLATSELVGKIEGVVSPKVGLRTKTALYETSRSSSSR